MKYWGKGVLCISGHFLQKRFENKFMQFQVLMGRESYDILELTKMIFKMEGEKIMKNEKVKSELMKVWQSVELLESVMAEFEKNGKAIDYEVCKKSVLLQRDALAEIEYMIETEEED